MTLNAMTAERLLAAGLDPEDTERVVRSALDEDLQYGPDVTSAATAAAATRAVAGVVAREPGVLAGLPVAIAVLDAAGIQPGVAFWGLWGLRGLWGPSRCAWTVTGSTGAPKCCESGPR